MARTLLHAIVSDNESFCGTWIPYLPMFANHIAIIADHYSRVPNSFPMVVIPFKNGADNDHTVLASQALQQLGGWAILS